MEIKLIKYKSIPQGAVYTIKKALVGIAGTQRAEPHALQEETPNTNTSMPFVGEVSLTQHKARNHLRKPKAEDVYPDVAEEVFGESIGPMPLKLFYELFMQPAGLSSIKELKKLVKKGMFDKVRPKDMKQKEKAMYNPFIEILQAHGICPKFVLRDTSDKMQKGAETRQRPDITVYLVEEDDDLEGTGPLDWDNMELPGEAKDSENDDPHRHTFKDKDGLEKSGNDASQTVYGQLLSYVASLSSTQHRTFTFAIGIYGDYVRFYRIDRAGVIVSERINYKTNPMALAEFFWRYNQLSKVERGFDPSALKATTEEATLLTTAVAAHVQAVKAGESSVRAYPRMEQTTDKKHCAYKIIVGDNRGDSAKAYIVRRSLVNATSPLGCATRGFIGVELPQASDKARNDDASTKTSPLVFIKDTWRVDIDEEEIETNVYADLADHGVPHLPEIICGGDVGWYFEKGEDGELSIKKAKTVQKTVTQVWANKEGVQWRRKCLKLRTLVHHRIVQELLYPVKMARDARELVQVISDVTKSVTEAYVTTGRAHRDIHVGNVMINASGRGVLIDWGHSRVLSQVRMPAAYRTGTWQFIPIAVLEKGGNCAHSIFDDLESTFWVFVYVCLHHFKHIELDSFDINLFDYNYYSPRDRTIRSSSESAAARRNQIPKALFDRFDKVLRLGKGSWKDGQRVEDQYPVLSLVQRRKANRKGKEITLVGSAGASATSDVYHSSVSRPKGTTSRAKGATGSNRGSKRTIQAVDTDPELFDNYAEDTMTSKPQVKRSRKVKFAEEIDGDGTMVANKGFTVQGGSSKRGLGVHQEQNTKRKNFAYVLL
ncbi:hypothetical protein K474DRAFT_1697693 [Panus rudis PR-1116 ss-1]|nr:hypothetical protein K474DRAFT_1697693 [Panus rudis PR-1116 ss-1]